MIKQSGGGVGWDYLICKVIFKATEQPSSAPACFFILSAWVENGKQRKPLRFGNS